MSQRSLTSVGIRLCIVGAILLVMGIIIIHPQTVVETEIDETIILASIFSFAVGIFAIVRDRMKRK